MNNLILNRKEDIRKKLQAYIDYWDKVVEQWFAGNIIKEEQYWFMQKKLCVNPMHMPEPYWGNPMECSVVIGNYNPGGGADRNRHTFRDCRFCHESFIHEVYQNGYYSVVKDFPILHPSCDGQLLNWWEEYGGRKWWRNKLDWMLHLVRQSEKKEYKGTAEWPQDTKRPFAIELCGWHSTDWETKELSKDLTSHHNKLFFDTVLATLKRNNTFAICIGKVIGDILLSSDFENVTSSACKLLGIKTCAEETDHINIMVEGNNTPKRIAESSSSSNKKGRNYRLLKKDGYYIISTWVQGSNHHPAEHFWSFEAELIKAIKGQIKQ